MRQQAEALEEAGRALEQTAALVKAQAELFERTVRVAREPTEFAKADRRGGAAKPARPTSKRKPAQKTKPRGSALIRDFPQGACGALPMVPRPRATRWVHAVTHVHLGDRRRAG